MAIPDNTIRCDEWYHPGCVGLREMALELVDTFFCPRCVAGSSFWVEVYGVVLSRNISCPQSCSGSVIAGDVLQSGLRPSGLSKAC